jgi:hypothetical protein
MTSKNIICFDVENFEEAYARDPLTIERVEAALAQAGALPQRVDFPDRVFCVSVERADLSVDSISAIFADAGLRVRLRPQGPDSKEIERR